MKRLWIVLGVLAVVWSVTPSAQSNPAAVKSLRLYVFDDGDIKGLDPKL